MNLKIYLHGQLIQELEMDKSQAYIAGRNEECDIVLAGEKGISRKHIKFSYTTEGWKAELLSRFGAMIINGESYNEIGLEHNLRFHAPPFEIHCEDVTMEASRVVPQKTTTQPVQAMEKSAEPEALDVPEIETEDHFDDEDTFTGSPTSEPVLKVEYPSGVVEQYRLEGKKWIIGRDPKCEICLDNDNISRKHFQITCEGDRYYLSDLGSSNGIIFRGERLAATDKYEIQSGDEFNVKKVRFAFLIRQSEFTQMAQELATMHFNAPMPLGDNFPASHDMNMPAHFDPNQPGVVPMDFSNEFNPADFSTYQAKHKIRLFAMFMLPIFIWFMMKPNEKTTEIASKNPGTKVISAEQKEYLKTALNLAQRHYNSGKYSSCLLEVSKIESIMPDGYENSKRLKVFCNTGKEQAEVKREQDRLKREKQKVDLKVRKVVERCEARKHTFESVEQARACLEEAYLLNPEAAGIQSIISYIERELEKEREMLANKAAYRQSVRAGQLAFDRAVKVYEQKKYRQAITALEGYLKTRNPDPKNNKKRARELISLAQSKMKTAINKGLKECRSLLMEKKYKDAMTACRRAKQQDPSNNTVSGLMADIRRQLSIKMKELYENAAIEENYGNIEASRDMWNKIVSEDFKDGTEYYHKAKLKLKQYGL